MTKRIIHISTVLICYVLVLNVACTQKAAPVITSRTTEPLLKVKSVITVTSDVIAGKAIFINRCGKCHDLPLPEQFTAQRWEGILGSMIPRAKLNQEQRVHVSAYIKANAKK